MTMYFGSFLPTLRLGTTSTTALRAPALARCPEAWLLPLRADFPPGNYPAGRCLALVDAIVPCAQRFEQLPVSGNNKTR